MRNIAGKKKERLKQPDNGG